MATHFSILAWRNPWIEESDKLQSIGSHRVILSNLLLMHAPYDQAVFWADIKKKLKEGSEIDIFTLYL